MTPKYVQLADSLRTLIRDGAFHDTRQLPTEVQLCEQYQVSRQTVRQALGMLVSEGLIEKRQGSGSHITQAALNSAHNTYKIAIITTYISDYIFPSILRSIQDVLSQHNCTMQLLATQNKITLERQILEGLLIQDVDGIIVEGTKTALPNPNLDLYRKLQEKGIPVIFINGSYADLPNCVSVLDDNFGGGYQLVEYLVSQGHSRIAGIFKSDDIQGIGRYSGYIHALRDHGKLAESSNPVAWFTTENRVRVMDSHLIEYIKECTATVCYNDEVAYILISLLKNAGIRVPQDMAVVSFDNSYFSELGGIKITSLSHEGMNTGIIAANKLLKMIAGESISSEVVPWVIKVKASSQMVPQN